MRKIPLVLILLTVSASIWIQSVHGISSGYERYKDDECEVYFEYLPIVPFDPENPTASEEFALKFYTWQHSYWDFICWYCPMGLDIDIYYQCDCGASDYVEWKRWYPTSTTQNGMIVTWTLGGTYGGTTLRANIQVPTIASVEMNYDKYYENGFLHVARLSERFRVPYATILQVEGAGSFGIPNELAPIHEGHHVLVWAHVKLWWMLSNGVVPMYQSREIDVVLGDDIPATTDCWLTVQEGNTSFGVTRPVRRRRRFGGGSGKALLCPTI